MEKFEATSERKIYNSHFVASERALEVLQKGRILEQGETPNHMIERVVSALTEVERKFKTDPEEIAALANEFGVLLDEKCCVMSTPVLTNAGRYIEKPLSACTVPSIDLAHDDMIHAKQVITRMHQDGMGTGFSLDGLADPIGILGKLNFIAVESASSGKEDRPVGNMATLSVYNPKIFDFINLKVSADEKGEDWKFNISVDCDSAFFNTLENNGVVTLVDGKKHEARKIFDAIAHAANACADPGLTFLERMEEDNPTPGVGHYVSTAPCAEVGLTKGESCQFGYINLAKFLTQSREIDIEKLKQATRVLTRMLDNALEISIENYSEDANREVMSQKRKIGIGICGLADLLIHMHIQYNSEEARALALDLITLINFESKVASHQLAKARGSFGAMALAVGNRHTETPSFIEKKYGDLDTKYVPTEKWLQLSKEIRDTRLLRNASTIALPPTGRSSLTIDASTGIEPIFSKEDYVNLHPDLNSSNYEFIQTAKSIAPTTHLLMAALIQRGVDESISKTINLPDKTTDAEIEEIYRLAWQMGLKGISIYREGSKNFQPKKLS